MELRLIWYHKNVFTRMIVSLIFISVRSPISRRLLSQRSLRALKSVSEIQVPLALSFWKRPSAICQFPFSKKILKILITQIWRRINYLHCVRDIASRWRLISQVCCLPIVNTFLKPPMKMLIVRIKPKKLTLRVYLLGEQWVPPLMISILRIGLELIIISILVSLTENKYLLGREVEVEQIFMPPSIFSDEFALYSETMVSNSCCSDWLRPCTWQFFVNFSMQSHWKSSSLLASEESQFYQKNLRWDPNSWFEKYYLIVYLSDIKCCVCTDQVGLAFLQ